MTVPAAPLAPQGPAYERGLWTVDLWRSYEGVPAVRGLSLEVAPGEVVGLVGPNGAGKSTALRMMCGLARADRGTARLGGVDVQAEPHRARAHLGFLAQDTLLYPRHTVRETLELFARLQDLPRSEAAVRSQHWLDTLELGPLQDRRVGTLSSGERQRANLARALVHDPPVVILDEPTSALDPETVDLLLRVVRQLREQGRAILLCTHALADAELVVDRAVLLHAGQVLEQGTLAELRQRTDAASLTEVFLKLVRAAKSR